MLFFCLMISFLFITCQAEQESTQIMNSIHVCHISPTDSEMLARAKAIFIDYFSHLYKNIPAHALGIVNTENYLQTIFEKTETGITEGTLHSCVGIINNNIVGFATFDQLERTTVVLLRTMPVALSYNDIKPPIRKAFLCYIQETISYVTQIIIMVRKANNSYRSFCLQNGFVQDQTIFEKFASLKDTYDAHWYDAYVLNMQ